MSIENDVVRIRAMATSAIARGDIHPEKMEGKVGVLRILLWENPDPKAYDRAHLIIASDGSAVLAAKWPTTTPGMPSCLYTLPGDFRDIWESAYARTIGAEVDRIWNAYTKGPKE